MLIKTGDFLFSISGSQKDPDLGSGFEKPYFQFEDLDPDPELITSDPEPWLGTYLLDDMVDADNAG